MEELLPYLGPLKCRRDPVPEPYVRVLITVYLLHHLHRLIPRSVQEPVNVEPEAEALEHSCGSVYAWGSDVGKNLNS